MVAKSYNVSFFVHNYYFEIHSAVLYTLAVSMESVSVDNAEREIFLVVCRIRTAGKAGLTLVKITTREGYLREISSRLGLVWMSWRVSSGSFKIFREQTNRLANQSSAKEEA